MSRTSLSNPVEVAIVSIFNLLLFSKLLEFTTLLSSRLFLGKFSVFRKHSTSSYTSTTEDISHFSLPLCPALVSTWKTSLFKDEHKFDTNPTLHTNFVTSTLKEKVRLIMPISHLKEQTSKQKKNNVTYPLSTPRTKLRTKKDPQMIRVTKYTHGQEFPTASFICKTHNHNYQDPNLTPSGD